MISKSFTKPLLSANGVVAGLAVGLMAVSATASDSNVARYRFATGSSTSGEAVALFATDGKVGPENSWLTTNRGRHRLNIFFERPTEIGSLHIYSGGDRDGALQSFSVNYLDDSGILQAIPGTSVSGNVQSFLNVTFPTPVTTTQLQIAIDDNTATIQEVAAFPPSPQAFPSGAGVNLNLARQHRLALTPATSTAAGSSRRAVVDGFINDTDYWQTTAGINQSITLDLRDPPETNPVSVRTETTPVEVGSVHLYSGLSSGAAPISQGRIQSLDENSGVWSDVPGGVFAGNTQGELSLVFDQPIVTAAMRLVVEDSSGIVREIVPLPPRDDAGSWPFGTSVIYGETADALTYDDDFYAIEAGQTGLELTSALGGQVVIRNSSTMISQQYQVLLNVGTDTYRIRNRATGRCLEPIGASLDAGAAVVEAEYFGFPSQRWQIEPVAGGVNFVNSSSGLILSAVAETEGSSIEQRAAGGAGQLWSVEYRDYASKKGSGGFPDLAETYGNTWAYNWGPDDTFPAEVDFWPMQWGSFNWTQRPSLAPEWQRNDEPIVLMGYNEPDKEDQANMPVGTAASMWPRLEVLGLPLLGPAVAGHPSNSTWIQDFMARADSDELRLEYVGMHSYGGPSPDSFINKITDAWNTWDREVVVSEFSVVDWNDNNGWTDDPVYNFFAEVLWRMEKLPYLHRYAVFTFTDDPANPISDNRGEMRQADGTLTPEGTLYSAWDGDTQIRTDTPYHLHNRGSFARIGGVPGETGTASITIGGRPDDGDAYQWRLVPSATPGMVNIESVVDNRVLVYSSRGLEMTEPSPEVSVGEFEIVEMEHGWFAIVEPALGRRLSSDASQGGTIVLKPAGTTSNDVAWRFIPVLGGIPGPPRGGAAESIGSGEVSLTWEPHGFRDLIGFTIYRSGPVGGNPEPVAADVLGESWIDHVPVPGTYTYSISATGDTGESVLAAIGAITVETCAADFDGDFVVDDADVTAAVSAIGAGLDYNGDGSADFFDVIAFLRAHDEGCSGE